MTHLFIYLCVRIERILLYAGHNVAKSGHKTDSFNFEPKSTGSTVSVQLKRKSCISV